MTVITRELGNVVTRQFKIRSVDEETRTVEGIAIPYGVTIDIPSEGIKERVARGAFGTPESLPLYFEHSWHKTGDPRNIGEVFHFEDTEEGLSVKARFNTSARAEEVYKQVLAKKLESFSAAFNPVEDLNEGDTVVRNKADLLEVSIVEKPAYTGAIVTQVRDEQSIKEVSENMDTNETNTSEDVTELRAEVTTLQRDFNTWKQASKEEVVTASKFRTAAEIVDAAHRGDADAQRELAEGLQLRYSGATTTDSHMSKGWQGMLDEIINRGRPLVNAFTQGPNVTSKNISYGKISALIGTVSSQVNEGDDFNFLKVIDTEAVTTVRTFGAYSELTRQALELSDVAYLQQTLEWQSADMARAENDYVRAQIVAATPQTGTSFTLSSATTQDFLKAVLDGRQKIYKNGKGANADFVIVSDDVALQMGSLTDGASGTGRPLFAFNGDGVNTLGNVDPTLVIATVAGLPVLSDPGAAAKTMYVASRKAVTSWLGNGGRIQVANPKNASDQYGVYEYLAAAVTNSVALVKPTIA